MRGLKLRFAADDMSGMPDDENTCACGSSLPPLILHPFSTPSDATTLLTCSKASELLHTRIADRGYEITQEPLKVDPPGEMFVSSLPGEEKPHPGSDRMTRFP